MVGPQDRRVLQPETEVPGKGGFLSSEPEELSLEFRAPLVDWPPSPRVSPLWTDHTERQETTDTQQLIIPDNLP